MVDTPTARNRLRKQELGTNTNTWGDGKLNEVIDAIDQALDGVESIALTGDKTLTSTNYTTSDESLNRVLKFTGALGAAVTVTLPSVEHWYIVINAAGAQVTVKTAAGAGVTMPNGGIALVYCDASDVINCAPTQIPGALTVAGGLTLAGAMTVAGKISGVTAGTANTDAVNKAQMDVAIATQLTSGDGSVANSATDTTRRFLSSAIQFFGALSGVTQDASADEWLGVKIKSATLSSNSDVAIGSFNALEAHSLIVTMPTDGDGIDGANLEDGDTVIVIDQSGAVATSGQKSVISGNGKNIKLEDQAAASSIDLDTNYAMVILKFDLGNDRWNANAYGRA